MNKAITALAALAALLAMAPSAAGAAPPLFGTTEFRAESLAALPKWQRALRRIDDERSTYRACSLSSATCPAQSVIVWKSVIKSQTGRPRIDQLRAVNRFLVAAGAGGLDRLRSSPRTARFLLCLVYGSFM